MVLILLCLCYNCCHLLLAPSIACCICFNCISSIHEHAASFAISSCSLLLQCLYCFCNLVRTRTTTTRFKPPVDRLLLEAGKNVFMTFMVVNIFFGNLFRFLVLKVVTRVAELEKPINQIIVLDELIKVVG